MDETQLMADAGGRREPVQRHLRSFQKAVLSRRAAVTRCRFAGSALWRIRS